MLKIKNTFVLLALILLGVGCAAEKPSDDLLPTTKEFTILVAQQTSIDADARFLAKNDITTFATNPLLSATEVQVAAAKCVVLPIKGDVFRVTCYERVVWRKRGWAWDADYNNIVFVGYATAVYEGWQK